MFCAAQLPSVREGHAWLRPGEQRWPQPASREIFPSRVATHGRYGADFARARSARRVSMRRTLRRTLRAHGPFGRTSRTRGAGRGARRVRAFASAWIANMHPDERAGAVHAPSHVDARRERQTDDGFSRSAQAPKRTRRATPFVLPSQRRVLPCKARFAAALGDLPHAQSAGLADQASSPRTAARGRGACVHARSSVEAVRSCARLLRGAPKAHCRASAYRRFTKISIASMALPRRPSTPAMTTRSPRSARSTQCAENTSLPPS